MSFSPKYSTQTFFGLASQVGGQSMVECRFSSADDITDVIAVHSQVSLTDCSVSSGRINYGGRLVCTVVYADESGKLCRVQKGAEFAHFIDGEDFAPAQTGVCRLTCLKTSHRRDGTSFIVTALIGADVSVYGRREISYLSDADGAVCRTEKTDILSAVLFSGESLIEDEFEADGVADVLIPSAVPLVYSSDCRAGAVEVGGEIALSLLAVRGDSPVCIERMVPFRAEIPCDAASSGNAAECRAHVSDLSVTARVDEERGKCGIECACTLAFDGVFYEQTTVTAVDDLFSPERKLAAESETVTVSRAVGCSDFSRRISSPAATKAKLDFSCALKAVAQPSCEYSYNADDGAIEGAVSATLIYEQSGELRSTGLTMPFSVKAEGDCTAAVCGVSVRQNAEGDCDAEAVLKLSSVRREEKSFKLITSVAEGEAQAVNDSAITVYVPAAGDGLWEAAKKLLKTPQEVAECNPDLKFPLTGKERIIVYRRAPSV